MKTSESIAKIAPALLKAQQQITFASKDATNPHFKNRYADLPAVIDAVKPALNAAGIVFLQSPSPSEDGRLHLTTRLIHESGEWIEDTAVCPQPKADPQGFGSASTYLRRYSLAAITGLYQDDDDGEGARPTQQPAKAPEKPLGTPVTALASTEQISELAAMSLDNATSKRVSDALKAYKRKDIKDFTAKEAETVIAKIKKEQADSAIPQE